MWHWFLGAIAIITLVFVIWMFVVIMSRGTPNKPKFFATRVPTADFACAWIDWEHNQIALLGEHIPFQTVELREVTKEKFVFDFHISQGGVAHGEQQDNVVFLQDASSELTLYSASPKDLMQNVADVYMRQTEQRAFRPNPKT